MRGRGCCVGFRAIQKLRSKAGSLAGVGTTWWDAAAASTSTSARTTKDASYSSDTSFAEDKSRKLQQPAATHRSFLSLSELSSAKANLSFRKSRKNGFGLETAAASFARRASSSALEDSVSEVDIENLIGEEKNCITERIRHIVQTELPSLARVAEYFFQPGVEGKRVRSSALLLVASSLAPDGPEPAMYTTDLRPYNHFPREVRRKQQRIAEITEMIHVASLLHDDVLDDAETRRGLDTVNKMFGDKVAILAGDFLLARASVALAALKNTEVVGLIATCIENLATGEMMQSRCSQEERLSLDYYYRKTFLKTASLIANSCKSVALLGEHDDEVAQLAYDYGYHLGMSFQLIDDVLDFVGSSSSLGKPTLSDLKSGIATAPVLFASEEEPQLVDLTLRKFKYDGDVDMASSLVANTDGIKRTVEVASHHSRLAMKAVENFPPAQTKHAESCREAMRFLARSIINRQM